MSRDVRIANAIASGALGVGLTCFILRAIGQDHIAIEAMPVLIAVAGAWAWAEWAL